jgi:hypothetical protein
MEMTPRGYVRQKKLGKRDKSRRHNYPHLDQDYVPDFLGHDSAHFAAAQAPRMPPDPRISINGPPPRGFPGKPSVRFNDEEALLRERLAFMGLDPSHAYPFPEHHGPPPGSHFTQDPRFDAFPDPPKDENSKSKSITIRRKDFADREVAAKYVAHLIKHGGESWTFKLPDGGTGGSGLSDGPSQEAPQRQRQQGRASCMKEKPGPFGYAPKQDQTHR